MGLLIGFFTCAWYHEPGDNCWTRWRHWLGTRCGLLPQRWNTATSVQETVSCYPSTLSEKRERLLTCTEIYTKLCKYIKFIVSCLVTKVHRSIKGKLCTSFTDHTSLCLLQYCSKGIIYEHATIKQFHVDKTFIMNSVEEDCWWLAMVKVNQTSHLISAGRSLVWPPTMIFYRTR